MKDGKKGGDGGKKKMTMFLVASNVVVSQVLERRLTGMQTACANFLGEDIGRRP